MTARTFLRLGPNGALGADDHQWILCREGRQVSFVRSTKAILVRCIREKGIELSEEGREALDALANDFDSWKADPARRGTPVAPEALIAPGAAENELQIGRKGRPQPTMLERLGPNCAIGTDGLQWIVFKAVSDPNLRTWRGQQWRAVGYVHSSKRALLACIAAKGLELSPAGRAAVERQDAKVHTWRRAALMEAAA